MVHRAVWLCALVLFACEGDGPIELPKDAARPFQPAAALPATALEPPTVEKEEPSTPWSPEDANVRATSRARIRTDVRPQISPAHKLAHKVYEAHFGPSARTHEPTSVVLTRHEDNALGMRLAGFALSDGQRFEFPPLHEEWSSERVAAIVFRDVDDDPDLELIVLASYIDPTEPDAPFFSNVVLDWNHSRGAFTRLATIEGEVEAFSNATAVLRHLRTTP